MNRADTIQSRARPEASQAEPRNASEHHFLCTPSVHFPSLAERRRALVLIHSQGWTMPDTYATPAARERWEWEQYAHLPRNASELHFLCTPTAQHPDPATRRAALAMIHAKGQMLPDTSASTQARAAWNRRHEVSARAGGAGASWAHRVGP